MSDVTAGPWHMPEGCDAPGRIKGTCVGHCIEIDAPPELVWDFIADFEGWSTWNPLYTATSGRAEPGATVHFTVQLGGMKPNSGKATVQTLREGEALEYGLSSFGGLLKVQRFVEVEELSPTRCAVRNGEIMGGPVGRLVVRAVGNKVGAGLEAMNRALKRIAESKWSGRRP